MKIIISAARLKVGKGVAAAIPVVEPPPTGKIVRVRRLFKRIAAAVSEF